MRDLFFLDPGVVFLNHGSFGACPRPVMETYQAWQRELEANPVDFLGRRSADLLLAARTSLAAYVGAHPDDLVFVSNATTAVNIVARSLELEPGDDIVTTDHEYGACDAALAFVCERVGATLRRVAVPLPYDPTSWVDTVLAAITPRTRLVFASHITSTTALLFPIEELCARAAETGVPTLIDGAHGPGQLSLDLDRLGATYYTGNCHKWLCGPKGSAFLHVRPTAQESLHATVVSWGYLAEPGGHTGFEAYTGTTILERRLQWQGTRDISAFLAVPSAIEFLADNDWERRRHECHRWACEARNQVLERNGLQPVAPDHAHGLMVLIPVRTADPERLRADLFDRHRIEVPVTVHAGQSFVRVSVHAYNCVADLDALVAALAALGV